MIYPKGQADPLITIVQISGVLLYAILYAHSVATARQMRIVAHSAV